MKVEEINDLNTLTSYQLICIVGLKTGVYVNNLTRDTTLMLLQELTQRIREIIEEREL